VLRNKSILEHYAIGMSHFSNGLAYANDALDASSVVSAQALICLLPLGRVL